MAEGISVDVSNYDQVVKDLRKVPKDLAIGLKRANINLKRQTGTVVRAEVTKVYNVKKSTVGGKGNKPDAKPGQTITIAGVSVPFYDVIYTGSRLSPNQFGMTPRARPSATPPFVHGHKAARNYQVRWKPLRAGGRQVLTSDNGLPAFIATANGGATAYVRQGPEPYDIDSIRRLSVPQMITNEKVGPNIMDEIEKRLEKELDRIMK